MTLICILYCYKQLSTEDTREGKHTHVSPRRPAELAAPNDVDVQVVHTLRTVGAVVDDRAEAAGHQALGPRDGLRRVQQVTLRRKWGNKSI